MKHQNKEFLRVEYFEKGKTQNEIALELGIKQSTISKWLKIHFTKEQLKEGWSYGGKREDLSNDNHWTKRLKDHPFLKRLKEGIRKGCTQSEEEKLKRSNSRIGYKHSKETRKKLSIQKLGNKNPQIKMRGEKSPFWKKDKTNEERLNGRKYNAYVRWRKSVYERDNYTCQKCGIGKGCGKKFILNAHHIESFATNKEKRTDLDNGITLCKDCHKDFHIKYTKFNNNRSQLIEFLNIN